MRLTLPHNCALLGIFCLFYLCIYDTSFAQQTKKPLQTVHFSTVEPACKDALLSMLPWERDAVEIARMEFTPQSIQLPEGQVEISISTPYKQKPFGRIALNITLEAGGVKRLMRAHSWVEVYKDIAITQAPIAKGHIMRTADIQIVRTPISRLNGVYISSVEEIAGLVAQQNLKAGQVVTTAMLAQPIIIRKGATVNIVAESPNISIATTGEAKQDGAKNDVIKVRNLMSNKEIAARIVDAKTVKAVF